MIKYKNNMETSGLATKCKPEEHYVTDSTSRVICAQVYFIIMRYVTILTVTHAVILLHNAQCWSSNSRAITSMAALCGNPHYGDVIMTMLASQITSLTVVYSIVYSGVNQRKHQSSASLAFVREIHRGPVNFPHKWPVTRKMFPFDDVIMRQRQQ